MATNLQDLKISVSGKCAHCGHPLQETFVSCGKHQNIGERVVPATPEAVLSAVVEATGIPAADITQSKFMSRRVEVAVARQLYAWLLRRHLRMTWRSIADLLGLQDHTSAATACSRIDDHQWVGCDTQDRPWFENLDDGVWRLHVTNLVTDLKVAYSAILRRRVKK